MKNFFILDTNVCLSDPNCFFCFQHNNIVLPYKVLEELDKFKSQSGILGFNARCTIKFLDSLIIKNKKKLNDGISLGKNLGKLYTIESKNDLLPQDFSKSLADNQIISVALFLKNKFKNKKIFVVSKDINVRIKCNSLNILTKDYETKKIINNRNDLFSGFCKLEVNDEIIDQFFMDKEIFINKENSNFYSNQIILLVSNINNKKTAFAKFINFETPLKKIVDYSNKEIWSIKPKNKEQNIAFNLLLDNNIDLVTLIGKSGSGKTLCSLAASLYLVLKEKKYKKIIVSRPIQPLGKDIGYLPGSAEEKILPWLKPIQDNLKYLFYDDNFKLEEVYKKGIIEIEALTYIRGRSISDAFIIIDEAQQLTPHELKTIITRVGNNTKLVLTGDIEQIDNPYINEFTNGLTYVIENFKEHNISGHITLLKGERSKLATLASEIL